MNTKNKSTKLPLNIRLLLGVFAVPSIFLAYMVGTMALKGNYQEVDYFEWIYSLLGFVAIYIAISGKRVF
jgi:cytochrome c oxidase assembly factor CtaG